MSNPLNSGTCHPTSCRYCCIQYLNGFYCGTDSQCGGISRNTATIVVISIVCGLLFIVLIGFIIWRLCRRRIETQSFGAIPPPASAIVQPVPGPMYGSQFAGLPSQPFYDAGSARSMLSLPGSRVAYH